MLGLTEDQLWNMSPRSFHNLLTGRLKKEKAEKDLQYIFHREAIVAILSPHMKEGDRRRAYREIEKQAKQLTGETTPGKKKKEKTAMTPEEVQAFLESQNKKKNK